MDTSIKIAIFKILRRLNTTWNTAHSLYTWTRALRTLIVYAESTKKTVFELLTLGAVSLFRAEFWCLCMCHNAAGCAALSPSVCVDRTDTAAPLGSHFCLCLPLSLCSGRSRACWLSVAGRTFFLSFLDLFWRKGEIGPVQLCNHYWGCSCGLWDAFADLSMQAFDWAFVPFLKVLVHERAPHFTTIQYNWFNYWLKHFYPDFDRYVCLRISLYSRKLFCLCLGDP